MKIKKLFYLLTFFVTISVQAQTLEGTSGLFFIPTAEIQRDGTVTAGITYLNKELLSFGNFKYNAYTPFIALTFLPFVELSMKLTWLIDYPLENQGIGDRTFNLRVRLIEEGNATPAVLVGFHDLFAVFGGTDAIHNNALYAVGSKNISLDSKILNSFSLHAGFGLSALKAANHNFVGAFGGVSFKILNVFELMAEYDGKKANSGLRVRLLNHISLLGGYLNNKYFSGQTSIYFQL